MVCNIYLWAISAIHFKKNDFFLSRSLIESLIESLYLFVDVKFQRHDILFENTKFQK